MRLRARSASIPNHVFPSWPRFCTHLRVQACLSIRFAEYLLELANPDRKNRRIHLGNSGTYNVRRSGRCAGLWQHTKCQNQCWLMPLPVVDNFPFILQGMTSQSLLHTSSQLQRQQKDLPDPADVSDLERFRAGSDMAPS